MAATDPMTPAQAIAQAALVLDFEAENSDVRTWRNECMSAARTLRSVASEPPPEWVQRDDRSLNHSNYNIPGDSGKDLSYTKPDRRRRGNK